MFSFHINLNQLNEQEKDSQIYLNNIPLTNIIRPTLRFKQS